MKKYYLLLAAGALGCALASLPVLASDAPTDEGNYIWQEKRRLLVAATDQRTNTSEMAIMLRTRTAAS